MKTDRPVVFTVIIPTFHRNDDLAQCLMRLAPDTQSLSAVYYEVIVTDDGRASTAESIVRERFPWVRWIHGPCRGPAANRNNGARFAVGEWLVFTDDDCLPDAGWLAAYAVASDGQNVLEGKTVACGTRDRLDMECPVNETGGYLWSCNFAVRKQLFEAAGGFDEQFPGAAMEDVDLRERLLSSGHRATFLTAAMVRHPWRVRRGMRYIRLHAESVAYFIKKNPMERARRFCLGVQFRGRARRILWTMAGEMRKIGCRGAGRQVMLDIYDLWCLWFTLKKHKLV